MDARPPVEVIAIAGREHEPLLDRFWNGLYLDAFAAHREPLAVWKERLWGRDRPYRLTVRLAGRELTGGGPIDGGVVYELYPVSNCALLTYLVVAPGARRRGLGRRLLDDAVADSHAAIAARGRPGLVLAEVVDPDRAGRVDRRDPTDHGDLGDLRDLRDLRDPAAVATARERLARFGRWGARLLDAAYVQPALGPGLTRDRGLRLIGFPAPGPVPATVDGAVLSRFVAELFAITEGRDVGRDVGRDDPELTALLAAIPAAVTWRHLVTSDLPG